MHHPISVRSALVFVCAALLAGCVTTPSERPAPPAPPVPAPQGPFGDPIPTKPQAQLPPASQGNLPFYEVMGERYHVLPESEGYLEKGVASWYGREFHGRKTSNGEVYDMYGMTAAHKTLPLPTNARVTNVATGKSIVVRINDRGPFKKGRIIDLSYGAARELGFLSAGTTTVEVEALGDPIGPAGPAGPAGPVGEGPAVGDAAPAAGAMYVQVGAFGDRVNAERMRETLQREGFREVVIRYDAQARPALFRVRIGPVANATEYDAVVNRVVRLNVGTPRLVVEQSARDGGTPGG